MLLEIPVINIPAGNAQRANRSNRIFGKDMINTPVCRIAVKKKGIFENLVIFHLKHLS